MKRFYFLFAAIFISVISYSQDINNLVVFCNDGEQFTLILNGARQNETPQTRVRVEGLTLKKYQVKIIYVNKKMKDTSPILTFYSNCWECEFALNKHGSKKHTMDFFTQRRMEGCGDVQNQQTNTPSHAIDNGLENTPSNSGNNNGTIVNQDNTQVNQNSMNNTNTNGGCVNTIANDEFNLLKSAVLKENSDADKHATFTSLLKNNCLTTLQVKDIAKLFTSEQARLDFVKNTYSKITDKNNYIQLLESFLTSAIQDEFKKFLNNKK